MASHLTVSLAILLTTISSGPWFSECTNFTIVNHCQETVWPGITPSENVTLTGSILKPGQSTVFTAQPGWHGRIWGRTNCSFDPTGNGTCQTGNCGSSLKCSGPGQQATIAEFTLGQPDFYDVSLVGGFNLPMIVKPLQGKGNCSTVGCEGDLRDNCPSQLTVKSDDGKTIACQSPCDFFNTDEYCCRGMFGSPMSCKATNYSTTFKRVCPAAYSYAYDDPTSIITCDSVSDYVVTFCASRNQTVCTNHDQQLTCNSSGLSMSLKILSHVWKILMLILLTMIS